MRGMFASVLVVCAIGCSKGSSDDESEGTGGETTTDPSGGGNGNGGGTGGGGGGGGGGNQPAEGTWQWVDEGTVVSDTCNFPEDPGNTTTPGDTGTMGDPDTFTISNVTSAGFTAEDDELGTLDCTLSGSSYACPDVVFAEFEQSFGPLGDATMTSIGHFDGTFSGSTTMSVHVVVVTDCEGDACDDFEEFMEVSFPCEQEFDGGSAEFVPK